MYETLTNVKSDETFCLTAIQTVNGWAVAETPGNNLGYMSLSNSSFICFSLTHFLQHLLILSFSFYVSIFHSCPLSECSPPCSPPPTVTLCFIASRCWELREIEAVRVCLHIVVVVPLGRSVPHLLVKVLQGGCKQSMNPYKIMILLYSLFVF